MVIAVARFVTEPLRLKIGAGPGWWYAAGAIVGVGVVVWRWRAGRRPSRGGP